MTETVFTNLGAAEQHRTDALEDSVVLTFEAPATVARLSASAVGTVGPAVVALAAATRSTALAHTGPPSYGSLSRIDRRVPASSRTRIEHDPGADGRWDHAGDRSVAAPNVRVASTVSAAFAPSPGVSNARPVVHGDDLLRHGGRLPRHRDLRRGRHLGGSDQLRIPRLGRKDYNPCM